MNTGVYKVNKGRRISSVALCITIVYLLLTSVFATAQDIKSSQSNASVNKKAISTLFQLVNQRLSVMRDVALHKWHNNLPIEDLPREKVVISRAVEAAKKHGLDIDASERFFSAQIHAAKEIQYAWIDEWRRIGVPKPGSDLVDDIRPKLVELGDGILNQLSVSRRSLIWVNTEALNKQFLHIVTVKYLSQETAIRLFLSLQDVVGLQNSPLKEAITNSPHISRLQQILQRGVLRVGTTGDYAPFTVKNAADGSYRGIDIEMAKNLANSLAVKLRLVETSWPTLSEDFQADKFDIAMGGVSINLKRARLGFFSAPYHSGGKTPIARCSDREKFDTLKEINQASTRVIVNPGGTNFKFAKANLTKAQVQVFDDNRLIFDEIVSTRADVMITDAIEVRLQSNIQESLCGTMPGHTLTNSEKGYWLQRDPHLKEYVDSWLRKRRIDGVVERIFDRHLAAKK